jgi:glycosyltransferase involved in cell wall biosynthesis
MDNMKNILMPVYNPIERDGRVQRAGEALSAEHKITVFCLSNNNNNQQLESDEYNIKRAFTRSSNGILNYIFFNIHLIWYTFRDSPDIIHAHDDYMSVYTFILTVISNVICIYDSHELTVPCFDEKKSIKIRAFQTFKRASVTRADKVICANQERSYLMQANYGLNERPVVIKNVTKNIRREEISDIKKKYPSLTDDDSVCIVYQGWITNSRNIGSFVSAMSELDPKYHLYIIGSGPDVDIIKNVAAESNVSQNTHFLGELSQPKLRSVMDLCNIGILTYPNINLNNMFCAPNKIYEYTQSQLRLVGNENPNLDRIIDDNDIGEVTDTSSIAQEIQYIQSRYSTYERELRKFNETNTWETEKEKLLSSYDIYR